MHHEVATLGKIGSIVPTMIQEVAPGDTWSGKSGLLVRFSPIKRALLQTFYIDQFTFYVPHRLVMADWEDFIAAGPMDTPTFTTPTLNVAAGNNNYTSLFLKPPETAEPDVTYSALRLNAYNLIFNEFFRDEQESLKGIW